MSRNTAVGKIMKEFIVIFSQEILSVFWYDSYLMDRPAGGYRFLVFLLLVLLNCPPNMCRTLKLFDQLHKKWMLCNVLKASLVNSCSLTVLAPKPFSIWTKEVPSKMTALTPYENFFTGGTNASKPVSSFTTKTMRHIRLPPRKNVTLSYPHKIDWRRLANVWYGSFTGSETLEIYIYR